MRGAHTRRKPAFCRTFGSALGRTRTCDLLIRRGTLRLFIGPVASRLAHDDGCFAWPIDLVDPSESARIPSCRWYRRWYRRSGFHRAFCTALTHHPSSPSNVVTVARLTLDRLVLVRIQVRQLPTPDFAVKRGCRISLSAMETNSWTFLWFVVYPR